MGRHVLAASVVAGVALLSGIGASAEPLAAKATKYDNVHIRVTDPAKATEWYVAHLGATSRPRGVAFEGAVISFVRADTLKPSAGSAIDHIAIAFPDVQARMRQLTAAGVKVTAAVTRHPNGFESGFIEDPWGTRIEILQDPQSLGFHHVHLAVADPEATLSWFHQMVGGERVSKTGGLRFGSVTLLAEKSPDTAPSGDRAIMNIAFRVADVHKAVAELKGKGVRVATEPTAAGQLWFAFLDAPSGVRFELLLRPPE